MEVFLPKPSLGWVWALGLALFIAFSLLIIPVAAYLDPEEEIPLLVMVMILVIDIPLFVMFAAIAAYFPAMRYEFTPGELVLRYGPLLRYRLPYDQIQDVHKQDLSAQAWSSMRWPGLALYKVPYSKMGQIRMCSTRMNKGVVLIETVNGLYGVSPAEEERFMDTLRSRARLVGSHN